MSWLLAIAAVLGDPSLSEGAQTRWLIGEAIEHGRLLQAREMIAIEKRKTESSDANALGVLEAQLALAEGRNADAFDGFSRLAGLSPNDCVSREGAGLAALHLGSVRGAQALLMEAVALCPDRWRSWSALGVLADRKADWAASAAAYSRARAIAPAEPAIFNNLGYSLILQHRFDEAEQTIREGLRIVPRNVRLTNNLDIAMVAAGKQIDPDLAKDSASRRATRLNNAGYIAYLSGRATAAKTYLEEALALGPNHFGRAERNLKIVEQAWRR